jgi:hypothetical protein
MFAVDLRAVRAPRGPARRLQPARLALCPSTLPVTEPRYATLRHKKDRAFAPKNPPSPYARTAQRASHFPSIGCALFGRALCALVPLPYDQPLSFHGFPHSLKKAPGIGVLPQKKLLALSELHTLQNANGGESESMKSQLIACRDPEPTAQPPMRQPHLCVIVSGRPPVSARRVSRIIKTQSEVHSL